MKKLLLFLFILGSLSSINHATAQPQPKSKKTIEQVPFPDLLALFVDEKYEKCLYKAEKYTMKDATMAQGLPYLFMSRCYYEISKLATDELKEKYPTASKDCLKYASKYFSKDKQKTFYAEYEDYFTELRTFAINEGDVNFGNQKYSQSKTFFKYLTDWDANDAGAWIWMGLSMQMAKQKKEADAAFKTAEKLLKEKTCSIEMQVQKDFLKSTLITYATRLYTEGSKSEAQKWMIYGRDWFMEDKEYQVTYSQIAE